MKSAVTSALLVLAVTFTVSAATKPKPAAKPFNVVEASISDMQAALKDGRVTSHELVLQYLVRIATYEDKLHAAITVNPNALKEADERDRERAVGKIRGPLHGIPIALKDNIQTTDLPTTGGALAFVNLVPPYDATLTKNLRDAGAIIMAKTQLTELANWVAGNPPMPTNYNALNGYGFNPYDPRRDPRTETGDGRPALATGGSSSGAGTTANFWAANVGSETSGSILSPSNQNMLAAIKPTVGRISRYGVIPITADQDTAGPMAKYVTDAAIMFGVLEGNNPDPNDAATTRCTPPPNHDYTVFLKKDGLKGSRIGIPRAGFYDKFTTPGATTPRGGLNPEQTKAMNDAIAVLKAEGAIVIDPADIPSVVDKNAADNYFLWGVCTDMDDVKGKKCSIDLAYGMERDFNKWLASLGTAAPVKSLAELRKWNSDHQKMGAIRYGQSLLDISDAMDLDLFKSRYESDRANDIRLSATHGIDEVMKSQNLDALLFPGPSGASIAARPGYPTVIVPWAMVPNAPQTAFPETFKALPQPFGVSFTGMACSEPTLLKLAYSFEQATKKRVPPASTP
ncbi:MAG: amidase [Acidobacteria bacterium]|nr:amidase [Acidobacteriota bacterium]MBV9067592.1 amidase [Acidobacteriota bacterium]MBV9184408.1 amidase [Acidobacteriota bacterium]